MTDIDDLKLRVEGLISTIRAVERKDEKLNKKFDEIETNFQIILKCFDVMGKDIEDLKSRITILIILHKDNIGKLNLEAEKWLHPGTKRHLQTLQSKMVNENDA